MPATIPTSPPAFTDSGLWTRRFLWLLLGVAVFRVVHLFTAVDFQLGGDEAYYWDWGRRPDWCYYSKPPLIGWLMAVLRLGFGYHWQVVRLAAIVLGTVSLSLLFALGNRLFGARTAFFAVVMLVLTPANMLANFAFTIDSPLMLCWTAALLVFWQVMEKPDSKTHWLLLTLIIGTGTLAKQMMLVFPGMMLLFALFSASDKALLKRPAFWLCILGSLAFLTPVLWWNAQHGWVTLTHTSEHFQHKDLGFVGRVGEFFMFPLLQAGVYSPLTFGVLIAALVVCLRAWKGLHRRQRYLLMFSAPGLAVFVLLALRQAINPNWPAVFYLSAFVLAADLALSSARLGLWMRRGFKLGGVIVLGLYLFIPTIALMGWTGHKRFDPCTPMRGWEAAGLEMGQLFQHVPHPEKTFVLVLDHRHYASQMAFSMPQHPRVYRWTGKNIIESQYEVWPSAADKIGWDCFVIYPDSAEDHYQKKALPAPVRHSFASVEKLGDADVIIGNGMQRSFQAFLGTQMLHWPVSDAAPGPKSPPSAQP